MNSGLAFPMDQIGTMVIDTIKASVPQEKLHLVVPQATLADLGIDSVDLVPLLLSLEEHANVDLLALNEAAEFPEMSTVHDIIEVARRYQSTRPN